MDVSERSCGVMVVVPHVPDSDRDAAEAIITHLLPETLNDLDIHDYALWYYTAMAIGISSALHPVVTIYDAMDELSAFAGASSELKTREAELFKRADLVFTGGRSLFEAKRSRHPNVYCFPSSVEVGHFAKAKAPQPDPSDQATISTPRVGFFGVVDERFDIELLAGAAELRPDYQFVVIGPVVKIDPSTLPRRDNIHYLGGKSYGELPSYLANWDVAMLPFARNESTRFISPTKTPEYLAAGKPVVSTSIQDVVQPYGDLGLVKIADTPSEFVAAIDSLLSQSSTAHTERADKFLEGMSWDKTWAAMNELIEEKADQKLAMPTATITE
jgi:UDP-galactopyranose mutase